MDMGYKALKDFIGTIKGKSVMIKKDDIIKRLEYICKCENIQYDINALKIIVDRNGTDIRSSINKIEELKSKLPTIRDYL